MSSFQRFWMIVIVRLSQWVGRNFRVSKIHLPTAISHRGKTTLQKVHLRFVVSHKAFSKSAVSLMRTMNRERRTGGSDLPVPRSIIPSFSLCSVCASSQCQATPMNQGSRKLVGWSFSLFLRNICYNRSVWFIHRRFQILWIKQTLQEQQIFHHIDSFCTRSV